MTAAVSGVGLLAALAGVPGASVRRTPVVAAVERVAPAVVHIATDQLATRREESAAGGDAAFEEFFRNFAEPGIGRSGELASLGSGLLFDGAGHVLTNEHVVRRAARLRVILADGRALDARLVGSDAESDLAVLQVAAPAAPPFANLGTSADLMIGETLVVIGNPFGLAHSVSTGVLSGRARGVRQGERTLSDLLQTDAAINPGNSGGPVVNLEGEVVGIATAVLATGHGIGFAIPIDRARQVIAALLSHGSARSAWLGIEVKPAGESLAQLLDLPAGTGLVVTHAVAGGPAARAGLRPGDVVAAAGGRGLASAADLEAVLAEAGPEQPVRLEWLRDGRRQRATARPLRPGSADLDRVAEDLLGVRLEARPGGQGVRVGAVRAGSPGERRGLRPGDTFLEVDGNRIGGIEAFRAAFYAALFRRETLLLVDRDGTGYYLPFRLE